MSKQVLIAGAGLGGLTAAIASARRGWQPRLFEQAAAFDEAGAGIQLGPNATRLLHAWGLADALEQVAAYPQALSVRSARSADALARLPLGATALARYGAPYATLHRADLQRLLLDGALAAGADLTLATRIEAVHDSADAVQIVTNAGRAIEGDALIGADGLWSGVRQQVWRDGAPVPTGHLAYRALVAQHNLPPALRSEEVTVWLGPRLHVVSYPVRSGEWLNLVAIVQGSIAGDARAWDRGAIGTDLLQAMGVTCAPLQDLVRAATAWRLWTLHERPPLQGAHALALGRIALLGDAAHPMRPYLAQGAGMAIEDAQELGRCLALAHERIADVQVALRRYALNRWERCARVQRQAVRNGRIFHATGPVQWGRDLSLRLLGERLLDQPWLYR